MAAVQVSQGQRLGLALAPGSGSGSGWCIAREAEHLVNLVNRESRPSTKELKASRLRTNIAESDTAGMYDRDFLFQLLGKLRLQSAWQAGPGFR